MSKVALYARYSSDNQSVASIEDPFRICREQWKVVGTYRDAAMSGRQRGPAAGHSITVAGRAARQIRDRARRGAGLREPRPGRRGHAVQASALRRHATVSNCFSGLLCDRGALASKKPERTRIAGLISLGRRL